MNRDYSDQWREDCARWQGRLLTGEYRHWCHDWDALPIDETVQEFEVCTCYSDDPKAQAIQEEMRRHRGDV